MLGAVDHYLGLAARAMGRRVEALQHFERATQLHTRIGAVPWQHRSRVERLVTLAETEPGAALVAVRTLLPDLERLGLVALAARSRRLELRLAGASA